MIDTNVGNCCAVNALGNTPPSTQRAPLLFGSIANLESKISAAMQRLIAAPTRDEKMQHWREMCRLIDQRSVHDVRFMERMRGLR